MSQQIDANENMDTTGPRDLERAPERQSVPKKRAGKGCGEKVQHQARGNRPDKLEAESSVKILAMEVPEGASK